MTDAAPSPAALVSSVNQLMLSWALLLLTRPVGISQPADTNLNVCMNIYKCNCLSVTAQLAVPDSDDQSICWWASQVRCVFPQVLPMGMKISSSPLVVLCTAAPGSASRLR